MIVLSEQSWAGGRDEFMGFSAFECVFFCVSLSLGPSVPSTELEVPAVPSSERW